MKETIHTLYQDLLRQFPFSITGYDDIENRIADYFTAVCKHPLSNQDDVIAFVVGLFGQLAGLQHSDFSVLEKIGDWHTKRLKRFFFCSYTGERAELPMSFYLYQLGQLLGKKHAINVLTENFRSDIDLRVRLSDDHHPGFSYFPAEGVFEISMPKSIFSASLIGPEKSDIRKLLQQALVSHDRDSLLAKQGIGTRYELDILEIEESELAVYEALQKEIYAVSFEQLYSESKQYVESKFHQDWLKERIFRKQRINIEELLKTAYAGSFLCLFFGIKLDYVLSTCRVVGSGEREKRFGLGGIAIGVQESRQLGPETRAFYKIIANQIASNLSGQITYELFRSQIYKERAHDLLSTLCQAGGDLARLTHMLDPEMSPTKLGELKQSVTSQLRVLAGKRIITTDSFKEASDLINNISATGEVLPEQRKLAEMFRLKLQDLKGLFEKTFPGVDVEIDAELEDIQYFFDFRWLLKILERIPYDNFEKHALPGGATLTIQISGVDADEKPCKGGGFTDHYLRILLSDTGLGIDDLEKSVRQSENSYAGLKRGEVHFDVLNTHGQIYVHSKGKKLAMMTSDEVGEAPKSSPVTDGTTFELLLRRPKKHGK